MKPSEFGKRPAQFKPPEGHLGFQLWYGGRLFVQALTQALALQGFDDLTTSLVNIMPMIDADGTQITVLAGRLAISKQAAGKIVQRLVGLGYLDLINSPTDGRAKMVVFTIRGQSLLAAGEAAKEQLERGWLSELSKDEAHQFSSYLSRILERAST
jgi:DNA-binding MarR family transcriptional regulator